MRLLCSITFELLASQMTSIITSHHEILFVKHGSPPALRPLAESDQTMSGPKKKGVFVTVGTTSFDELVKAATEESFMKVTSP